MTRQFVTTGNHLHRKLHPTKTDPANKLQGAQTEQPTVEQTLDLVLREEAIVKTHRGLKAMGGFEDIVA